MSFWRCSRDFLIRWSTAFRCVLLTSKHVEKTHILQWGLVQPPRNPDHSTIHCLRITYSSPLYFDRKKPSHVADVCPIRNHQQGDVPKPQGFFLQKKRAGQTQDVISFNATLSSCNRAQHWQMTMSLCDELQHEMQMDVTSFKALAESCVTWNVEKQQDVLLV